MVAIMHVFVIELYLYSSSSEQNPPSANYLTVFSQQSYNQIIQNCISLLHIAKTQDKQTSR